MLTLISKERMEFKIGSKVQAIDELGRWENGRIISLDSNNCFEVKFDGWGADCNIFAKAEELRKPVDIFTGEIDAASKSKRKRGTVVGRNHLSILHSLAAGDKVFCTINETLMEAIVKVIDRFLREVTVQMKGESEDRILSAKSIVLEEKEDPKCERRRKKVQKKTRVEKTHNPKQSDSSENTDIEDGTHFFSATGGDGSIICCGEVVQVMATTLIQMLVSSIQKKGTGFEVHGCLFTSGLSEDIKIGVPAKKVAKLSKPAQLTAKEKKTVKEQQNEAFAESLRLRMSNFQYRKLVRQQELRHAILVEVHAALRSKFSKRRFSLGISSLEIDLNLFKLDFLCKRHAKFSYYDDNLWQLDSFLGDRWDVLYMDNVLSFVTQITISLTKQNVLQGSVSRAQCYDYIDINKNYRKVLALHISNGVGNCQSHDYDDAEMPLAQQDSV